MQEKKEEEEEKKKQDKEEEEQEEERPREGRVSGLLRKYRQTAMTTSSYVTLVAALKRGHSNTPGGHFVYITPLNLSSSRLASSCLALRPSSPPPPVPNKA